MNSDDSQKKLCHRVLTFIGKTPWAIKPDALEKIISIATRSYSDPQLVAAIKSEQSLLITESDDNSDIAVIDVFGPIFTRADFFSDVSGAASLDSLERRLDEALYDDSIKAIILRIDSPGGEVTGTHEFANYLDEACEIKPIVAYVQGMACSAAYWIASATSHIYVDKTATLGSIGVVAAWTDDSKARTAAGLTDYEVVSSQSPKKRLDPKLDDGRAELQKQIDGLADIFIDDVAAFRDVSRDKVLSDFGQGSTFLANEAINLGMADEISSLRDVIAELTTADTSNNNTNNLNNINNNGVSQMGVKSKRDKQNFSLKATGKTKADDDEKDSDDTGAEDLDEDRNESSEDDEDDEGYEGFDDEDVDDEEESSSEDDDDKETDATKKAISAFARKNPRLYRAILKRGARTERRRIASIEKLNIVGHKNLIHQAKYSKRLTAEQTSYAVLKAEQQQRSKLSDDYASDGSYRVPTSAASVTNKNDDIPSSFFENVAAGARAVLRGKK
jgi:Periplasmic serine proteases (ClpP class)